MLQRLIVALVLILSACGSAAPIAQRLDRAPGDWVERTPRAAEIDGRALTPQCSGAPGSDSAFKFWARRGSADKLLVYFDGGGACWDAATCSRPALNGDGWEDAFYSAEIFDRSDPRERTGVFALGDPRNPFRDWSFVVVPYCTGDVHSGANTADYVDPETGAPFRIEHRGADNFQVVLEWMKGNFDAPAELFVTGSSAGAYGATFHYARIREAFPKGRGFLLGDAGQGVSTEAFGAAASEKWKYDFSSLGTDVRFSPSFDIVTELAGRFPDDRFAQYTTAHDSVQKEFYAAMGVSDACTGWTKAMTEGLAARKGRNFRYYLAPGDSHTILGGPLFQEAAVSGKSFAGWMTAMLSEDGAAWTDIDCGECIATTHCPAQGAGASDN